MQYYLSKSPLPIGLYLFKMFDSKLTQYFNRYRSKQKLRRKRNWSQKTVYEAKNVGIKQIDEQMRAAFAIVNETVQMRRSAEKNVLDLCDECSLPECANMAQCLRIITLRMASCTSVITYRVSRTELEV